MMHYVEFMSVRLRKHKAPPMKSRPRRLRKTHTL